jgi:CRP-like cAMP-binding protein
LESGDITAMKESREGRSLIVTSIQPGEIFFGLAFFCADMPMIVALVANENSRLHLWSRESLVPVLQQNGRVTWELSCSLVQRMQRASDIVEELAFQPVTGRLARLLLEQYGDAVGDYMAREMTLDEMAARIGSTREMVCRQLSRFADQQAISISRTEFMITDQGKLEQLAQKGKG